MKFNLPEDFADLSTGERASLLKDAETALGEGKEVYFNGDKYTNYDQLRIDVEIALKLVYPDPEHPRV